MAAALFVFVQLELAGELGPPDGRYVVRPYADGEVERVIVIETLGAPVRTTATGRLARKLASSREVPPEPEPASVATTRVTVIDPVSLASPQQADAWLAAADPDASIADASAFANRVLAAQRIAAADPHIHDVPAHSAIAARAGYGEGEQVAYGRWVKARELLREPGVPRGRRARVAALRPQERFAALLGARSEPLLCEELALRARADLDHGREPLASLELDRALSVAPRELRAQGRPDLDERADELEALRPAVAAASGKALAGEPAAGEIDSEALEGALSRLEAALRARTATGFSG